MKFLQESKIALVIGEPRLHGDSLLGAGRQAQLRQVLSELAHRHVAHVVPRAGGGGGGAPVALVYSHATV